MEQFTPRLTRLTWALTAGVALLACSDDDNGNGNKDQGVPDASLAAYGEPCQQNDECSSQLCVVHAALNKGFCSKTCKRLSDCPPVGGKGWDCGELTTGEIACYPRTYRAEKYGMAHDCSLDGVCGAGYICMGNPGDADRYCSNKCQGDMDCPPQYRCSQVRVGTELEADKWCRRRAFCHPCVIDDQCGGPEDLCVKDINGNGYCSQTCSKTGATCPSYAKCEDAGNNKFQCRHKAGACYKSLEADGGLCDPCIIHGWTTLAPGGDACVTDVNCPHYPKQYCLTAINKCLPVDYTIAEEGVCQKGSYCLLLDQYTGEAACIDPCTDTCPSDTYFCGTIRSLGAKFCVPVDGDGYITSCHP
jgi:hypothetical protein